MKIGVIIESFRKPLKEAVKFAGEHGFDGIQLYAADQNGDFNLVDAPDEAIRDFRAHCDRCGVEVSAVCGDISPLSFQVESECMQRAEALKKVVVQAAKLGVSIITTHIGHIPESVQDEVYPVMVRSVRDAAQFAASKKCRFAIETGPELADVLKTFIENVNSPGLGVNLDPANLRGVSCEDPVYAVKTLAPYIVHTHAKDAVNTHVGSSAKFYKLRNADGSFRQIAARAAGFQEVPLGQGMVDWKNYLAALKEIGYDKFLTIEREVGEDPVADIMMAYDFLKKQI